MDEENLKKCIENKITSIILNHWEFLNYNWPSINYK